MLIPIPITQDERQMGLMFHVREEGIPLPPPAPRCIVCKTLLDRRAYRRGHDITHCTYCGRRADHGGKGLTKRGDGGYLGLLVILLCVMITPATTRAQGNLGSNSSPVVNRQGIPLGGVSIAVCQPLATTGASVSNGLATLVMSSNPVTAGYVANMPILVAGFTGADTYLNAGTLTNGKIVGGFTILSVSSTAIVFAINHVNASASTNGTVLQEGNGITSCAGLSPIFQDTALSIPATNPTVSDQLGNWNTFALSGFYDVQFYSPSIVPTMKIIGVPLVAIGGAPGLAANNIFTGSNTFNLLTTFGAGITGTGPINSTNSTTGITSCITNSMFMAGSSCYPLIVNAENAACALSPNGSVYIPATYAGTDTFNYNTACVGGFPAVVDMRQRAFSVASSVSTASPAIDATGVSLPFGADLRNDLIGPSDWYVAHGLVASTTTANISIGVNTNILLGAFSCVGCTKNMPFSGAFNFYLNASLVLERDKTNEEVVPFGSWSIVDANHITFIAAKTHSGTTDVEQQQGANLFTGGSQILFRPINPAQLAGRSSQIRFLDSQLNYTMFWPANISDPWPYSSFMFVAALSGGTNSPVSNGAIPGDLILRNSSASVCTRHRPFAGPTDASFCDSGIVFSNLTIGNGTSLTVYRRIGTSISPALVAANTCSAQSFTVTGLASADVLIGISKPTEQAGLSVTPGHVTGTNTTTLNFCNNTAVGITPTAAETYQFVVVQ